MLPNANLSYLGLFKPHSTVSCVASSVASILLLLCSSVQAAEPLPSTFQTDAPKSSSRLLGYNEHRTDLPGGRHANVRTNRAVVVQVDGQRRRPIGSELFDDPALTGKTDAWTQFAGWSPDGKWIAYGSKRNGVRNLFVMRLADRQEHALTDLPEGFAAMHAYWQP
jgi:hypothetical protein